MLFMNRRAAVKVSNRAGYLEDTGIGSGRETEAVGDEFQHAVAGGVQFTVLFDVAGCHLGVAVDFGAFIALKLDLPGALDPFGNCGRTLSFATVGEVAIFNGRYFDMDIDAVKQRAGDAGTIAVDGDGGAGAGVGLVG